MQFSPKILGLNATIFGTVFDSLETDLGTDIGPCVWFVFYVLFLKNE